MYIMNIFVDKALQYHQKNGGGLARECEILVEWKRNGNACLISIDCPKRSSAMLFAWFQVHGWVLKRQLTEAQSESKLVRPGCSNYTHETNPISFRKRFLALPDGGLVN
jgi:hypothetical protein